MGLFDKRCPICGERLAKSLKYCPSCGYVFRSAKQNELKVQEDSSTVLLGGAVQPKRMNGSKIRRHALFVGVNTYDDTSIRRLRYSIPDASVLADRFKSLGYKTRLLADPTGAELKKAVMESVEGLGSGDVFLFFFAGHGFTSQDGAHLLFCRDDIQRLLRENAAGTRVNAIEALTSDGGFHRAFLLDSCRTDSFANVEWRGGGTTRDLDFVSVPECTKASGSFYLLRSCDKFRPSLEFDAIGHGLFTQGLLDAMDARDNRLAYCDTSFATAVAGKMEGLQRVHNVSDDFQRPSIGDVSGPVFSLFDGDYLVSTKKVALSSFDPLSAYVVCPECGKHNLIAETFRCKDCGRDHLCLSHFSLAHNFCTACAKVACSKHQEDVQTMLAKGDDYCFGRNGVKQDYIEAIKWYRKAAEHGHSVAQYNLGWMYDNGYGVAQSDADAVVWYRKAAEQGNEHAQYSLGRKSQYGKGVVQSDYEAVKWYRKAAENGYARAQGQLGWMYDKGRGVPQSCDEAVRWYFKAAEKGDRIARNNLGWMYENGRGVWQSAEKAVEWYLKAAEQGDVSAQWNMGRMCEDGSGVTKSREKAVEWYRRAADKGNEKARQRLSKLQIHILEEQTDFDVIIKSFGMNKISVIAVIREITGLGLTDAKKMVEHTPSLVKAAISKGTAENIAKRLRGCGAEVEVRTHNL